ncbi:MAG: BrnT family toxin [Gammaproteobacteria bacterium]|nr:BrnT family toxin [Gammaproteobacteria bacterium]
MEIKLDPAKSNKNTLERGLPFDRVLDLDWSDTVIIPDIRYDYPEPRYIAVGYLEDRLHVTCFTPIENSIRVISLRKANAREAKHHGKPIKR